MEIRNICCVGMLSDILTDSKSLQLALERGQTCLHQINICHAMKTRKILDGIIFHHLDNVVKFCPHCGEEFDISIHQTKH